MYMVFDGEKDSELKLGGRGRRKDCHTQYVVTFIAIG